MQILLDMFRYLAFIVIDGDYLNDWLTHLPVGMQEGMIEVGKAIAIIFGS